MSIADRSSRVINLEDFTKAGIPETIGELDLSCPHDRQYILRMAIRVEGGAYIIPCELEWLREMLDVSIANQHNIGVDHPFCYVTVRHGIVDSQTDDEWHVDGFSMKVAHTPEQNYIWCDSNGTEYTNTDVVFPDDFDPMKHNVHRFLSRSVGDIHSCDPHTVYCMDPYLLHRRPVSTFGEMRTFVRISFVPIEINDVHNTQNELLLRVYSDDGVVYRNRLLEYGEP